MSNRELIDIAQRALLHNYRPAPITLVEVMDFEVR